MRVKLLEVYGHEYDEGYSHIYTPADATKWEEVGDEDYKVLLAWVQDQNRNAWKEGRKFVLFCESQVSLPTVLASYVDKAKQEMAQKAERERKVKEKSEKRAQAARRRQEKKERQLLEELSKKYKV